MNADALLAWRKRLNLTQEEAARRLGCGRRTLVQYERGESPVPKTIALAAAAIERGIQPIGIHEQ
jgi:transcriptional regulator with XRE-family HTH domain